MAPVTKKTLTIKRSSLTKNNILLVKNLQKQQSQLKEKLKILDSSLSPREDAMILDLEAGFLPETGSPPVSVKTSSSVRPKWKEVFIAYEGEEESKEVIAKTKPSFSKKLIIL